MRFRRRGKMIYNDFNGLKLSRLGFGCMRFALDPATGEIDQDKVNAMFTPLLYASSNIALTLS